LQPGSPDMASCTGSAYDEANNYPITLMQDGTGSNADDLAGYLDDVRIWDRPLSSNEVKELYIADTKGKSLETVYLPLDNNLNDASGNNINAVDAGTAATKFVDDPERGRVAYFEKAAYAKFPKVNALRFGTGDFSFSLWVKCSPAAYTPVILGNKNWSVIGAVRRKGFVLYTNESNSANGSYWSVNAGDGEIEEGGSGNDLRWNAKENGASTISDNKWHFVAVSFDRDKTMDVYLDGALLSGSPSLTPIPGNLHDDVNDYPLTLMQDPTGKFFMDIPAYLDDLRIWNRTITSGEVASLYNHSLETAISEKPSPASTSISVYPIPSNSTVNVAFNAETPGKADILVYSNMGSVAKEVSLTTKPGMNKAVIDVKGLTPGIYLIRIIMGSSSSTARLVVAK